MSAVETVLAIPAKKILVVEDDFLTAHSLRLALAVDGHQVEVVDNAEEALKLFAEGNHDLIITDFKLPNMDGLELAEAIKTYDPARPVVLITAFAGTLQVDANGVSNVDLLLIKPVSLAKLHEGLRTVFQYQRLA